MSDTPTSERSIRLIRSPTIDGVGVFSISQRDQTAFYTFHEIPCFIGGRGFVVHRLGIGQAYHVRIGTPEECSCECLGFLRHGQCRHIGGLLALAWNGKL